MSFNFTTLCSVGLGSVRQVCRLAGADEPRPTEDGAWFVTARTLRVLNDYADRLMAGWAQDPNQARALTLWEVSLLQTLMVLNQAASEYIYQAGLKAPVGRGRKDFLRQKTHEYRVVFS